MIAGQPSRLKFLVSFYCLWMIYLSPHTDNLIRNTVSKEHGVDGSGA